MSVLQYTARGTGGGTGNTGPFFNVWHIQTGTLTTARANAHIGALKTFYTSIAAVCYTTSQQWFIGEKVVAIDATPPVYVPSTAQTVTGTNGTAYCPPAVAWVVSWKTTVATRSGRGRTYLGPLSQSVLAVGGGFNATQVTTVQNAANKLLTDIKAIDPADYLCVFHRATAQVGTPGSPGYKPATPNSNIPIGSAVSTSTPYTQRRRGA